MPDPWGRPLQDEPEFGRTPITSAPEIHPLANGFMIEQGQADGLPHYFSLKDIAPGASASWTSETGKALQFARKQDAEAFAARYLLNMSVRVVGRNG